MDCVSPADQVGPNLAEPDRTHLARGDEIGHRPHRVLDGNAGIETVAVVQVDDVGAQSAQTGLTRRTDILGAPVELHAVATIVDLGTELRGEHDAFTATLDRLSDHLLVVPESTNVVRRADASGA